MSNEFEELLTVREVARRLSVTERTIFRWYTEQGLPVHRIGPKSFRFRWSEIEEWMDARANVAYPVQAS